MKTWILIVFSFCILSCKAQDLKNTDRNLQTPPGRAIAGFAAGCFWCTEHIFEAVPGVDSVISGYAGGNVKNPTYELVNTETTGHAESVLIYYNPAKVSFQELVKVFFLSHDPTTINQQGPDRGSSYRSIAFFRTEAEKEIIQSQIRLVQQSGVWKNEIVTELKALTHFYNAEDYHQDYIKHHPNESYVQSVSVPRYNSFRSRYKGKLKY